MPDRNACAAIDRHIYAGDSRSSVEQLQEVLARGSSSLHRLAYKFLGNTADAEDAVQDAVFAAYRHLDDFRGDSQMSTWLHVIVANRARMYLRKQRRYRQVSLDCQVDEQEYSFAELMVDERPSPEDEYRFMEANVRVSNLISQLPPTLQKTFQLRHAQDLSIVEIASIMAVPTGTVKARLARARAKLIVSMRRVLCSSGAPAPKKTLPA